MDQKMSWIKKKKSKIETSLNFFCKNGCKRFHKTHWRKMGTESLLMETVDLKIFLEKRPVAGVF